MSMKGPRGAGCELSCVVSGVNLYLENINPLLQLQCLDGTRAGGLLHRAAVAWRQGLDLVTTSVWRQVSRAVFESCEGFSGMCVVVVIQGSWISWD